MPASEPAGALTLPRAAVLAALAGLACMALELTAVRLLAPFFGDSAYVWTNVIGVILLALALGALVGGRFAERPQGAPLRALLAAAAALLALTPLLGPPLAAWLLPQELPLDHALPALVRGSLAATIALFALPVLLLGGVSPGLVVAAVRGGATTGRAAGAVGAAGTLGSLAGTFLATHWLVPTFGCRAVLWGCAATLALAAIAAGGRRPRAAIGVAVLVAASGLGHGGSLRPALPGSELLASAETRYQYLRVVRTAANAGAAARTELKINEGLDSFHSVAVDGRALTSDLASGAAPGSYYDYHALVPFLVGDGSRPADLHTLSIGDAAGTFRRAYAGVHPGARVDAVEIDPVAVAFGDRYFAGPRAAGDLVTDVDGRVYLERTAGSWHVVHVDAYSHQVNIPAHLASREFFVAVQRRLRPGGIVACNVGGLAADDPVLVAVGGTMAAVFGAAVGLRVPNARNFLLLARQGRAIDPAVLDDRALRDTRLAAVDAAVWARVVATARTAQWIAFAPASEPLTDDRPVIDRLLYRSYVDIADVDTPTAFVGADAPAGAEAAAYAAYARGDSEGALAAARRSRAATAYLHLLCGKARWLRRELAGALADHRAAVALDAGGALAEELDAGVRLLGEELAPVSLARQMAARNGWLGAAGAALAVLFAAGLYRMSRMPAAPSVRVSTAAR